MATRFEVENAPPDSVMVLNSAIQISAPAEHVFDILTRTETWPQWNTFMPSVETTDPEGAPSDGRLKLGTKMVAQVRLHGDSLRAQPMTVVEVGRSADKGTDVHNVCWKPEGFPNFALRGIRYNNCRNLNQEAGGALCEYRTWEWQ